MSTRETLLAAIATTLSGVASGRVYRTRREQLPTLPAVVITPDQEEANEDVIGAEDSMLTVAIDVYAKGDTPDNAADATLSAVWSALRASIDLGQGANVQLMPRRSVSWDTEDYDMVRATLRVTYLYRTATGAM
jgi:hypothetical protein